jgi:hypothetical protein
MLKKTCDRIRPLKGSPIKKIASKAPKTETSTPTVTIIANINND